MPMHPKFDLKLQKRLLEQEIEYHDSFMRLHQTILDIKNNVPIRVSAEVRAMAERAAKLRYKELTEEEITRWAEWLADGDSP